LRLALRRGEWVLGDSAELEAAAVRYGARPDRLRRVVSGIDLPVFTPGVDGSQVHARFGVSAGPVLFCPRTLRPIYDQESIIRAMPEIRRAHPAAHLILAGSRDDDPSYVAVLDELLTDLDLVDSVHFAGRIPNSEMPAFYGAADLVVSVPKSDSRPSSLFEAMACGVPVVVSDVPAILEIVQREQNGLVIPVGDFEALAEGVCRLLADKALREQFVHHNLVLVQKQGNYEAEMARVAALYDELIARYRSQRGTSKPR